MAGLILVGAEKMGKDSRKESKDKGIIFEFPDGFEFPEDRTKTEVLAEIHKTDDGKIMLASIDGYALPMKMDEEPEGDSEEEFDEDEAEGNIDKNENSLEGSNDTSFATNADEAFASDEQGY
jgi:hypothetical protein